MSHKQTAFSFITICLISFFLFACTETPAESETTTPTEVSEVVLDWERIDPGGETRCSKDTPYAFWVRPGTSNNVFIYFQGGGGCFDAATCGTVGSYKDSVPDSDNPNNTIGGIFDLDNPQNPFKDDHLLFVPYCTGDVHSGNQIVTYDPINGESFEIFHHGNINVESTLEWLFSEVETPERVFVSGCSAGSIGSIIHTPRIIEQYPDSYVVQLGDSGGGLTSFFEDWDIDQSYDVADTFPDWIPGMDDEIAPAFTISKYTTAVSNHYPNATFAQYNAEDDSTQRRYYVADGGQAEEFPNALQIALNEIDQNSENFYSYTGAGERHCILKHTAFYNEQVDDVFFHEWVTDLAHQTPVETIK